MTSAQAVNVTNALHLIQQGLHSLNAYYRCNDPQGQHDITSFWSGLNLCDLQVIYPSLSIAQALGKLEDLYQAQMGGRVSLLLNRYEVVMVMKG